MNVSINGSKETNEIFHSYFVNIIETLVPGSSVGETYIEEKRRSVYRIEITTKANNKLELSWAKLSRNCAKLIKDCNFWSCLRGSC